MGPQSHRPGVLMGGGGDTRHSRGRGHMRTQGDSHLHAYESGLSRNPVLAAPWSWTSCLQTVRREVPAAEAARRAVSAMAAQAG